eukprot:3204228-Rhodomonas_salina.2
MTTDTPLVVTVEPETVEVPGVGQCISAADFVSLMSNKNRRDAQACIRDILKGKGGADAAQILCRKAEVLGFCTPTYVVTYEECFDLLQYLPRHRVKNTRRHITSFFQQTHSNTELRDTIVTLGKRKAAENEDSGDSEGPGYVYAAYSPQNGVKIGMTCQNDPMKRIRALNTCVRSPYQLIDLLRCGNPSKIEAFMHQHFARARVGEHNRELFDAHPEAVVYAFAAVRKAADALQAGTDDPIDPEQVKTYLNFAGGLN